MEKLNCMTVFIIQPVECQMPEVLSKLIFITSSPVVQQIVANRPVFLPSDDGA